MTEILHKVFIIKFAIKKLQEQLDNNQMTFDILVQEFDRKLSNMGVTLATSNIKYRDRETHGSVCLAHA